jgi:hypothetical protein
MTQFLRFPDEFAWLAAVADAGFMADDTLVAYTHDRAIDVVGTITRGGEYSPEMVALEVLPGWHVNYIGVLPPGWEEFLVEPEQPYRVFA